MIIDSYINFSCESSARITLLQVRHAVGHRRLGLLSAITSSVSNASASSHVRTTGGRAGVFGVRLLTSVSPRLFGSTVDQQTRQRPQNSTRTLLSYPVRNPDKRKPASSAGWFDHLPGAFCYSHAMRANVRGPTTPSDTRPSRRWNSRTASSSASSNTPGIPSARHSRRLSQQTRSPVSP